MKISTKIRIIVTLTAAAAAAAGFAAGRASASLRFCPARCPLETETRTPEILRNPGESVEAAAPQKFEEEEEISAEDSFREDLSPAEPREEPVREDLSPAEPREEPVREDLSPAEPQEEPVWEDLSPAEPQEEPVPVVSEYIGNRLSKIFHDPSCRYCANTSDKYRVELHSVEDAVSQGFKPCRRCLPE